MPRGKVLVEKQKRKHYNKNKWGEGLCMNDRNKRGLAVRGKLWAD